MRDEINQMILQANIKVLGFIFWVTGVITFIDIVDFGLRVLSGVIAIGVGVLAWKNYSLKNQLLKKEIELKDQELGEKLLAKKRKA